MSLTEKDIEYFDENNIFFQDIDDDKIVTPIYDFLNDRRINGKIVEKLKKLNFTKPTPIQAISIPTILTDNDFIGISKTGSGKTLAFLVPALMFLIESDTEYFQNGSLYPAVLIVAPTRELALQINEVVESFEICNSVCVYGGSARSDQMYKIKKNKPPVIIGTPGRINDFIDSNLIDLSNVCYLVLDEADRMFDMGFHPQIMKMVDLCPPISERQTLLFSATWESKVETLANEILKGTRVLASIGELKLSACDDIKQHLFVCKEYEKRELLKCIVNAFRGCKILIFVNTKAKTEEMSSFCTDECYKTAFIHGDVCQTRRIQVINDFNKGIKKVIFATDVASRGLDIENINVVVNFDFPMDVTSYVHRIGRSGRNGKKGLAFTFITDRVTKNSYIVRQLKSIIEDSGNEVPENLLEFL